MAFMQEERLFRLETPLGSDVLLFKDMEGEEGISRLFTFKLNLLSENPNIEFKDIIGKSVTVVIDLQEGKSRYFNGIVSEFYQLSAGDPLSSDNLLSHYTAIVVPYFWLLTRTTDSRIFQNKNIPDIVEKIFGDNNLKDYKLSLKGSYQPREYCVQYRETDFNFVSRLLEEEGIFYYFQQEDGKHTLILADDASEHKACPEQALARCKPHGGGTYEEDMIDSLRVKQEIRAGKYTLNDFNFEMPNTTLKSEEPSNQKLGPGEREYYDYPGRYAKKSEGDNLSKIRMQEEEAQITTFRGASNCRAFTSGYKFKLQDFYRRDMDNKEYVLTRIRHTGSQTYSIGESDSGATYKNEFTCMPADVPFRPVRITTKPFVQGAQTAIVVGPSGEEIYPDKYGRVKVQFHWDREGKKDDKSSCWVRVSQLFAGAGWGAMFIPRIGHEVIVDFLEGDPDRPIITGRVYHGNNNPPYPLPDQKTKSTIKTNSSPGGGGFNELRFEDKKGKEEIYLQGEKDWNILIKNNKGQNVGVDDQLTVGNNQRITIGVDRTETVGKNETITIGVNKAETIGAAKELTIGGAYQVSVGAAMNETVGGLKAEEIGAHKTVKVAKDSTENIGGNQEVDVGKDLTETVGGNKGVSVDKDSSESVSGKKSVTVTKEYSLSGKKISLTADEEVTIKTGSAKIVMKKNGDITIEGKKITIKGSGDVVMKGQKITQN